jgi:hypothetical protein
MTPHAFVRQWQDVELSERSSSQSHFNDLCTLLGEPKPVEADPKGEWYTFEKGVRTPDGKNGFADVWKKGHFGWEYKRKGKHKNLGDAYAQLLRYREALDNPPLLVVCDIGRYEIRTNFTNHTTRVETLTHRDLTDPAKLNVLRRVFRDPNSFDPGKTRRQLTEEIAGRFCEVADGLRARGIDSDRAAHFLVRLVFCMFVEHAGLLTVGRGPERVFTDTLRKYRDRPGRLAGRLADLFDKMSRGGDFGSDEIRHFNGGLFDGAEVVELTPAEVGVLLECAEFDWAAIEPTISGTLFERIIDPAKRARLGAHFTSPEDIETLLRPVFLDPLRREWAAVRAEADDLWAKLQPAAREASLATRRKEDRKLRDRSRTARERFDACLRRFFDRLATVTVLDPACGSGNFLYVALRMLLGLYKEVWQYASARDLTNIPFVSPRQFYGLEVNEYARELAETMLWIGYLQWGRENPIREPDKPVLGAMNSVARTNAILDLSVPDDPKEPVWPDADFIVGNPPFLGGKMLRMNLGDAYVDAMFQVWRGRVGSESDLCCYWFEKARAMIEAGRAKRAGLLATQGIRGGANRQVLNRIKRSGDIFFAVSDQDWWDDGTAVHISMVGFDEGTDPIRVLDGKPVRTINPNLTASADITTARRLGANAGVAYMGDTKGGPFDITCGHARQLLDAPNVNGRPGSDVVTPWCNGLDVTRRGRDTWIIDFGPGMTEGVAARYEAAFAHANTEVRPERHHNKREAYRLRWWLHVEARSGMRAALAPLPRFLAVARVAKHLMFVWMGAPTLPDCQLIAFARADDYFFGVLHSRVHEVWARAQGTQVRERESGFRYTPTTCFETFPFPAEPFPAHRDAIAAAAKELDRLRTNWLNPPEWTRTEVLEFPGSADGPWKRYVADADPDTGVGTVRYPRVVPKDDACAAKLKARTLTNLYNERPAWLANAHRELDELVFAAYGWRPDLSDDDLLARLLDMNLAAASGPPVGAGDGSVRPRKAARR